MRWPFAVARRSQELQPAEKGLTLSTKFAFKLFRELIAERESQNVFISPASVFFCLWLLREGATGDTESAMNEALEVNGLTPEAMQRTIANLKSALQIQSPDLTLELANSLWCNPQWAPRREYVDRIREEYSAEVRVLESLGSEMVATINRWVSEKTHHKIDRIVDALDPMTSLVVLNAIYFKALWAQPFMKDLTRVDTFHTTQGRELKIPLMNQFGRFLYYEEPGFQTVRLGYKDSRLCMYVFLPARKSSMREFCESLTTASWEKWMKRFDELGGSIRMPRFRLAYGTSLNPALGKLGMGIAFDPDRAEFDRILPRPPGVYLSDVRHQSMLEINEEGTEAAAVTSVMVPCLSSQSKPARTFQMILDRPFCLAICDDHTKNILFLGAVEEPQG